MIIGDTDPTTIIKRFNDSQRTKVVRWNRDEPLAQSGLLQEQILIKRIGDLNHSSCPIPFYQFPGIKKRAGMPKRFPTSIKRLDILAFLPFKESLIDNTPTQAFFPFIKDHSLTGSNGPSRF